MRTRSIKPSFFIDSKLLKLPMGARLLFAGLWCAADRDGRMVFDPDELRRKLLPDETASAVREWFVSLEASGLVLRYSIAGREYLAIPNFLKHQNPFHKERASTIPGPDPNQLGSRPELGTVKTVQSPGHDRSGPGSLFLVPGSLSSGPGSLVLGPGSLDTTSGTLPPADDPPASLTPVQIPRRSRVAVSYSAGFLEAWAAFPHYEQRSSKAEAWGVWQKRELEAGTMNVLAWIEAGKLGEDWTREGRRFVPGFHVWLKKPDFTETPPVQDPYDRMAPLMSENARKTMATMEWAASLEREKAYDAE